MKRWGDAWAVIFRGCPSAWKLTRAVSDGGDAKLMRHIAGCLRCARISAELKEVATGAPALSAADDMTEASREEIALHLLAADDSVAPLTGKGKARYWSVLRVTAAVGAVAAVVLSVGATMFLTRGRHEHGSVYEPTASSSRPPAAGLEEATGGAKPSRASIRVIGRARFARIQSPPNELVRLDDGTIELEVTALPANERFRVATADAEVEVKGTRFKVTAAHGNLVAVHVWHGRVEVRSHRGAFAVLQGGDDWVEAPNVSASAGDTVPTPAPRSSPARSSFDRAWALLRAGDVKLAADAFAEVQRLAAGTQIEEDALYWRAIAVGRANDKPAAGRLLRDFLERYPRSSRAGEASTVLGWLLLDSGDLSAARAAFGRALHDPSPRIRASARDGASRADAGGGG